MDVVCVLLVVFGGLLSCARVYALDGSTEPNVKAPPELELFPPKPTYAGQTRMPRTLFKKLHSGVAFLAGLKLGSILSKKGFELGQGKIASTHSFQLFGKSVNSAMSLSYGNTGGLLPLLDDADSPAGGNADRVGGQKDDKRVFRVTVVENPGNDTADVLASETKPETSTKSVLLYQDFVEREPETEVETNFIGEHNKRVKEFNEGISRRKNSKF